MKILVTGANGFIGSHVVERCLQRGHQVVALVRGGDELLAGKDCRVVRGDVRRLAEIEPAFDQVDAVIHTAGVAGVWGPWEKYFSVNVLGTRNVIQACLRQRASRLVYTSSPSVTFDGRDQINVDERTPLARRWLCHYQHTKAMAEQEVLQANKAKLLRSCALRPHLVWGVGDRHLIPGLLARGRSGRIRQVGNGQNKIDITHVENAASAHVLAAEVLDDGSAACGKAYFISQGEPVNCWQWISQILEMAGLPPVRKAVSFHLAWSAGGIVETFYRLFRIGGEPRLTRFVASQLAKSHYFNISRARRDLGYHPEVTTAEGMQQLARTLA